MPIFLNIEKYFHSRIYTKAMQYWLENICEVYDFGKLRVSCKLQITSRQPQLGGNPPLLLLLFNPELHEHITSEHLTSQYFVFEFGIYFCCDLCL